MSRLAALISLVALSAAAQSPPPLVEAPPSPPTPPSSGAPSTPVDARPQFEQLPDVVPGEETTGVPVANLPLEPEQKAPENESALASTRSKHFLALLTGGVGVGDVAPGVAFNLRVEVDAGKLAFLAGYTHLWARVPTDTNLNQGLFLVGWAPVSSDLLTLRLLAGLDILSQAESTGFGPAFSVSLRSMLGFIGLDSAVVFTPAPFRQLEARASVVLSWKALEVHLGWRFQLFDATIDGSLERLFSASPAVQGPLLSLGLAL